MASPALVNRGCKRQNWRGKRAGIFLTDHRSPIRSDPCPSPEISHEGDTYTYAQTAQIKRLKRISLTDVHPRGAPRVRKQIPHRRHNYPLSFFLVSRRGLSVPVLVGYPLRIYPGWEVLQSEGAKSGWRAPTQRG